MIEGVGRVWRECQFWIGSWPRCANGGAFFWCRAPIRHLRTRVKFDDGTRSSAPGHTRQIACVTGGWPGAGAPRPPRSASTTGGASYCLQAVRKGCYQHHDEGRCNREAEQHHEDVNRAGLGSVVRHFPQASVWLSDSHPQALTSLGIAQMQVTAITPAWNYAVYWPGSVVAAQAGTIDIRPPALHHCRA